MKEFRDVQKCTSVKEGVFTAELADDNLFEWDIRLYKFDQDSLLARDLKALEQHHGIDNVWVR